MKKFNEQQNSAYRPHYENRGGSPLRSRSPSHKHIEEAAFSDEGISVLKNITNMRAEASISPCRTSYDFQNPLIYEEPPKV
jgi:hypothetical protein